MQKKLLFLLSSALLFSACSLAPKNAPKDDNIQFYGQQSETTPVPNSLVEPPYTTPTPTISPQSLKGGTMAADKIVATQATIQTSAGEITVELYPEEVPNTVENFLQKAKSGYYEGLIFHRVEDWVIQGGDPKGNGTGGGNMPTELSDRPFEIGTLGVARGGDINISNDSQFFICTADCSWLTKQYTNFGKVTKGMEIAKKVKIGDKILGITYK